MLLNKVGDRGIQRFGLHPGSLEPHVMRDGHSLHRRPRHHRFSPRATNTERKWIA